MLTKLISGNLNGHCQTSFSRSAPRGHAFACSACIQLTQAEGEGLSKFWHVPYPGNYGPVYSSTSAWSCGCWRGKALPCDQTWKSPEGALSMSLAQQETRGSELRTLCIARGYPDLRSQNYVHPAVAVRTSFTASANAGDAKGIIDRFMGVAQPCAWLVSRAFAATAETSRSIRLCSV